MSEGQIEEYDKGHMESLKNVLKQFTGTDVWFIIKEECGDRMTELMQLSGSVIKDANQKYRYKFDNIVMPTAQRPPQKSTLMAD